MTTSQPKQEDKSMSEQEYETYEEDRATVDETVAAIEEAQEKTGRETRGPYHDRENTSDPDAPEEEQIAGEQQNAQLNVASSLLSQARDAVTAQNVSDERLKSDPRYERDQKVFMMGQRGELGAVPPSDAEQAAIAAGMPEEVIEELPESTEEQVEDDMKRLKEAEQKVDEQGQIRSGVQESDKSVMVPTAREEEEVENETVTRGTPIK